MKRFLREYWLWIVVPFVLVIGALVLLYLLSGGEGPSPFTYDVF